MLVDYLAGPFEVTSVRDNELHFVTRRQILQVGPAIARAFAARGALQIHYLDYARVEETQIPLTGSLDQHRETAVQQQAEQTMHAFLEQRFATRHLDQIASVAAHALDDLVDREMVALVEGILRIAQAAT